MTKQFDQESLYSESGFFLYLILLYIKKIIWSIALKNEINLLRNIHLRVCATLNAEKKNNTHEKV